MSVISVLFFSVYDINRIKAKISLMLFEYFKESQCYYIESGKLPVCMV